MLRKISFLFFFIFLSKSNFCYSQLNTLNISITDINNNPIPDCYIKTDSLTNYISSTNKKGFSKINIDKVSSLKFEKIGYQSKIVYLSSINLIDTLKVILAFKTEQLKEAVIIAEKKPIYLKENIKLLDFEIINNKIWCLFANGKNDNLIIYNLGMDSAQTFKLSNNYHSLGISFNNNPILFTKDSAKFFDFNEAPFCFYTTSNEQYVRGLKKVKLYNEPYYYRFIDNDILHSLSIVFYKNDKHEKLLYNWLNYSTTKANVEDYKKLTSINYFFKANEINEMSEVDHDLIKAIRDSESKTAFYANTIFKPVNCDLISYNNQLLVYNFENDSISLYTSENIKIRDQKIHFNKKNIKNRSITKDRKNGELYFTYQKNGVLHIERIKSDFISTSMATIMEDFPFYEKYIIYDHKLFLLYNNKRTNTQQLILQEL